MQTPIPDKLYTPERMGRRGEGIAWAMALITGLTWLILGSIGRPIPQGIAFLAIFFLLSAGCQEPLSAHPVVLPGPSLAF